MKNLFKSLVLLCSVVLMSFAVADNTAGDCSMAHDGTFTYTDDEGKEVVVVIKGDSHMEYHNEKAYTVEAKIKWLSDCEYTSTMVKETIPAVTIPAGTVMHVKIDKIDGNFIYYTAKVVGQTFSGSMKKITAATATQK